MRRSGWALAIGAGLALVLTAGGAGAKDDSKQAQIDSLEAQLGAVVAGLCDGDAGGCEPVAGPQGPPGPVGPVGPAGPPGPAFRDTDVYRIEQDVIVLPAEFEDGKLLDEFSLACDPAEAPGDLLMSWGYDPDVPAFNPDLDAIGWNLVGADVGRSAASFDFVVTQRFEFGDGGVEAVASEATLEASCLDVTPACPCFTAELIPAGETACERRVEDGVLITQTTPDGFAVARSHGEPVTTGLARRRIASFSCSAGLGMQAMSQSDYEACVDEIETAAGGLCAFVDPPALP